MAVSRKLLHHGFDRITAITDGVDAVQTQQFQYDALSRLVRSEHAGGNVASYGYDAVGNRVSLGNTVPVSAGTYTYAPDSNRLLQAATGGLSRGFTYDATGNVTAYTDVAGIAHTLAYDPFGRLASHTAQGMTTSYTVNALDQRMGKRNASHQSRYVYAGFNQLLAEYTDGAWTSYVYRGGEPVALVRNSQLYYLHGDHLGRPQLATNARQQVVWKAANRAFDRGVTLDTIGGLNLGFPGQYYDAESGLWHNGYREYEASLGRYLQSDPIGLAGGVNTYAYVLGNPVNLVDSFGLWCLTSKEIDIMASAAAGAVGLGLTTKNPWGAVGGALLGAGAAYWKHEMNSVNGPPLLTNTLGPGAQGFLEGIAQGNPAEGAANAVGNIVTGGLDSKLGPAMAGSYGGALAGLIGGRTPLSTVKGSVIGGATGLSYSAAKNWLQSGNDPGCECGK